MDCLGVWSSQDNSIFKLYVPRGASEVSKTSVSIVYWPHLQARLQHEIRQHAAKHDGKLTYDNINELEYLAMVIHETLRMYPPLPFLDRIFTPTADKPTYSMKPYADFSLPPGMPIFIPIFSIQRDPKYFSDPNTFNPDRFAAKNRDNLTPYTLLAFGTGPHNCIGERFGVMQVKIGLITILKNYMVEFTSHTPKEMVLEKKALILQAENGIHLNIKRE
ncbi:Cytochrome P450 [Sergentomyia squamirostris]